MKSNVQDVISIYDDGRIMINLDCIIATNHIVRIGELLLFVEDRHVDVVRLIGVRNTDDEVYLTIKDQKTGCVHEISRTLDPDEKYPIWWVVSYEYILDHIEDRVLGKIKGTELLEFDF